MNRAVFLTMAWFLWSWHQHEAATLVLGMWFGAILRDLRTAAVVSSDLSLRYAELTEVGHLLQVALAPKSQRCPPE